MTMLASATHRPLLPILLALSGAHLLNDLISSMIPAMYPLLKEAYRLDFAQVGLITLAFQVTSSLLQPLLGFVTDHKPWPYAMVAGMAATLSGLVGLAAAGNSAMVLVSAGLIGLGSAVFHPEATRMARHAAAGQQGFAQGIFQIGGEGGIRDRAVVGGDDRCPARADEYRLGIGGGAGGDAADGLDWRALL